MFKTHSSVPFSENDNDKDLINFNVAHDSTHLRLTVSKYWIQIHIVYAGIIIFVISDRQLDHILQGYFTGDWTIIVNGVTLTNMGKRGKWLNKKCNYNHNITYQIRKVKWALIAFSLFILSGERDTLTPFKEPVAVT